MSLEQRVRDMNDEWSWTDDIDPRHSKHSISQSSTSISMSLSKRTLPSLSTPGLQPLPFDNYNAPNSGYSNQSLHIIHNNNNNNNNDNNSNNTDDIKQNEQHKNNNKLNIIYDNKNFTKFNKTYKFNHKCDTNSNHSKSMQSMASSTSSSFTSTALSTQVKIIRISNLSAFNLCFKETVVSCPKSLKRCINEYKALHKFHNIFDPQNASKYTALYVNKKKSSHKYPKTVRLLMRYYPGDDLDDFLVDEEDGEVGFLYEDDFRTIMKKILWQLNICRQQNILHCDIKPNNIRINEQSEKYEEDDIEYYAVNLIDFGFAHLLADKKEVKLAYIKGTPGFIAPETMRYKKYSHKSDMFSVGCVAFFLLTNHYAVIQSPDMDVEDMMPDRKRLKHLLKRENDRNRDDSSRIHGKTIEFVLSCLWRNPAKRPTAKQALKLKIFE